MAFKWINVDLSDFQEALRDVQPSAKREGFATIPDVTWEDIGALEDVREELTMAIIVSDLTCLKKQLHSCSRDFTFTLRLPSRLPSRKGQREHCKF